MKPLDTWTLNWPVLAERVGSLLPGRWAWQPFGPDGIAGSEWSTTAILTVADHDGEDWLHASIAKPTRLPSYFDLVALHEALWPHGFAYQVFASQERHVSIHDRALHLWGRADGANVLPDFGEHGTI